MNQASISTQLPEPKDLELLINAINTVQDSNTA